MSSDRPAFQAIFSETVAAHERFAARQADGVAAAAAAIVRAVTSGRNVWPATAAARRRRTSSPNCRPIQVSDGASASPHHRFAVVTRSPTDMGGMSSPAKSRRRSRKATALHLDE